MPRGRIHTRLPNWDILIENSIGGYELYKFICEVVVWNSDVNSASAAALRCVNKSFREFIDYELPIYMQEVVNPSISAFNVACLVQYKRKRRLRATGIQGEARRRLEPNAELTAQHAYFTKKFSYCTADHLQKCITEFIDTASTFRNPGLEFGWVPDLEHDRVRFSATVHSFLMLANDKVCELNIGSRCECRNALGTFTLVPSGQGLLMRCGNCCMNKRSVVFNPNFSSPCQIASYEETRRASSKRESNFLANLLIQNDISPPYKIEAFKSKIESTIYENYIRSVYSRMVANVPLGTLTAQRNRGVKMMLLDNDSILNDSPTERKVPSLQFLIGITNEHIRQASKFLVDSDCIVKQVLKHTEQLMRAFATTQIIELVNEFCKHEGLQATFLSISEVDLLLPGAKSLIERSILDNIEQTPIEQIYTTHVMSRPFTNDLIRVIACALGRLKRHDTSITRHNASKFAYAFISGVCAGNDGSFDLRNISTQVNKSLTTLSLSGASASSSADTVGGVNGVNTVLAALYVFDLMGSTNIEVSSKLRHKTESEWRLLDGLGHPSLTIYEVQFDILGATFVIPMGILLDDRESSLQQKFQAGEAILQTHGYSCNDLRPLPDLVMMNTYKKRLTASYEFLSEPTRLAQWIQDTLQIFASTPETRSIAIDMITRNNTKLFIECVAERDIDAFTIAELTSGEKW